MTNPKHYVGRIVQLKREAFAAITQRAQRQGMALDNRFLVAAVTDRLGKLICYGANFRIVVGTSEVALI